MREVRGDIELDRNRQILIKGIVTELNTTTDTVKLTRYTVLFINNNNQLNSCH